MCYNIYMNSEKNKEKIIELLMKLERKEIDQDTFNKEYDKFVNSEEYANNIKEAKRIDLSSLKQPWCIFFLVAVILLIAFFIINPYLGREYVTAKDLGNIDSPIQIETDGSTRIKIDDTNINIYYLYTYEIRGKALATYHYLPTKIANKLSPVDVGIGWGYLLNDEHFDSIKWSETGSRRLTYRYNDGYWKTHAADFEGLYSNNHLIPSNKKIRKLIKKIKPGDYIELKGYLVNIYWSKNNYEYYWESSTTREDTGDGACEVFYVTDIKWLKEDK